MTNAPPPAEKPKVPALIEHLWSLVEHDDRGALAALRRGAGKSPGHAPEVFRHVTPRIPDAENYPSTDWPYYVVASLFALHPEKGAEGDIGWTCAQLGDHASAIRRFEALLAADNQQLPSRLRHVVSLAAGTQHNIPVDWTKLLRHLRNWDHPDRWVQRQWARSYWLELEKRKKPDT